MSAWLAPGVRVAWIGDSHSEALGPRLARSLPAATGVVFVRSPVARRGWSVRRYLSEGDVPALVAGADLVIVELGGNDASLGVSAEQHARDVERLLAQIGSRKVIWVGPGVTTRADLAAARAPVRQAQAQVVRAANGEWIDSSSLTRSSDLGPDGVHFRVSGYDHWATQLLDALKRVPTSGTGGVGAALAGACVFLFGMIGLGLWASWRRRR